MNILLGSHDSVYRLLQGVYKGYSETTLNLCTGHMIRPVTATYSSFKKGFCREKSFIYISLIKITWTAFLLHENSPQVSTGS